MALVRHGRLHNGAATTGRSYGFVCSKLSKSMAMAALFIELFGPYRAHEGFYLIAALDLNRNGFDLYLEENYGWG
jgi:hypothetical protein